jgi:hypothetical protein
MSKNNNPIVPNLVMSTDQPIATIPATFHDPRNLRSFFGLLTDVQMSPTKFTVLNIETNRDLSYEIIGTVNIENRYGNAMAYNELRAGMILEIGYDAQSSELVSLTESSKAWELKSKSNVKIDVATSSISLGNEKYIYNNDTLVLYKGEPYLISRISSVDTVSLTGYGNNVWCVQLESSHGFLKIENTDKVINGSITVDRSIIKPLSEVIEPLMLEEGPHTVNIEGDNITTYTQSVTITTGETSTLSLLNVELKPGQLQVTSSEPDREIIIDGVAVAGTGPWEVSFGEHIVRVEKDGFLPVEQSVNVDKVLTTLNVVLPKIVLNAKLHISTIPSPAEVYVDGEFIGNSPVTYETQVGPHSITARLTGYSDSFIPNYEVVEGENSRILILQPSSSDPLAHFTPPPSGQPIIDEPYPTPPFDPYNPNTPTPVPTYDPYSPNTPTPAPPIDPYNPNTPDPWPQQTPIPTITPMTPFPFDPIPIPTPPPTPLPNTNPIFEEGTISPTPTVPPW